jgi:hypothetical protein
MRHVTSKKDDEIPRDEEFKFKERAQSLVNKWSTILNASKGANGSAEESKATANGDAPEADAKANGAEDDAEMTTANGAEATGDAKPNDAEAEANAGDTSVLADVTMSEA